MYDGDANRVKKVASGVTTFYIGNHYEVTNNVATKYYYFGKQRVAMRTTAGVTYLHGDHLGSTSATSGASVSAQTYYAFGNIRGTTGTVPTDFGFTGQRRDASANLMYYGARYYDSVLGRFVSADTIVPSAGNPQSLNRYAYVLNNPLRYVDPTGHTVDDYYVFVQGCINYGQEPAPCGNDPKVDWHDYLSLLRAQVGLDAKEFNEWLPIHVRFLHAPDSNPSDLAKTVDEIDPGEGEIFLIGHSAGGATILNYLNNLRENSSKSPPRIGGAAIMSAPIGETGTSQLFGSYIGFKRNSTEKVIPVWGSCRDVFPCGTVVLQRDNFAGLGAWAKSSGMDVLTVSYGGDYVNPITPTADIPFKLFPRVPGFAGRFDIGKNHGYFFSAPNSIFQYLIDSQVLR